LGLRRCDKQQAIHHGSVLEEVEELHRKGGCAGYLPGGVRCQRRGKQESQYCYSRQLRIDAEGQTKACNYFNGSSDQHEKRHQAGGRSMFDELFCSSGLADDPETIQTKTSTSLSPDSSECPLSSAGSGSSNFPFHLVFFPAASLPYGGGFRVVAVVAWIAAIESGVVNLFPYPSLP